MARSGKQARPTRRFALLGVLLLAVAATVAIAHRPALTARAVSMNDGDYVTQNYRVQNPSWANAGLFLSEVSRPATVRGYYQPLAMISLMLDSAMGGKLGKLGNLGPYHRTSLLLHVANTILVGVLLYILLGEPWAAAVIALLFGLHPMTVEVVAWLGERKTPLATFFALNCLILYVRYARRPSWKRYAAVVATFVLALLSKPTVTPLPVLMLLLDYWPLRRLDKRAVIEKAPLLAIAAMFAVITVISQRHVAITRQEQLPVWHNVLLAGHDVVFYPLKMIWPSPLSCVYPFPEPVGLSNPMILLGVIVTVLLVPALVISLRWTRALLVGCLFFLAALSPTLMNIAYAMGVAADKYAYLPSIGLLLILAAALSWAWSKLGGTTLTTALKTGMVCAALAVAGLEARATHRYLADWQDTGRLCNHILSVAPNTAWAHNQLGSYLLDEGDIEEALKHCREAVRLDAGDAQAEINLGQALTAKGTLDEAIASFKQALSLKPDSAEAHDGLGIALAARGDLDEAVTHFQAALASMGDRPQTHVNLALALAERGRDDQAIVYLRRAIELKSDYAEAHFHLGRLLAGRREFEQAVSHFERALQSRPDSPEAHFYLGCALAESGQFAQAVSHFRKTLEYRPGSVEAYANLGRALVENGQIAEAVQAYRAALNIDADNAQAQSGLAAALARQTTAPNPQ